jgi:hypothetical protein
MGMSLLANKINIAYLSKRVHNSKLAAVHSLLLCLTLCLLLQHGSVQIILDCHMFCLPHYSATLKAVPNVL